MEKKSQPIPPEILILTLWTLTDSTLMKCLALKGLEVNNASIVEIQGPKYAQNEPFSWKKKEKNLLPPKKIYISCAMSIWQQNLFGLMGSALLFLRNTIFQILTFVAVALLGIKVHGF